MLKKSTLLIATAVLLLSSCIDHEVIPPPVPTVDLNANFYGIIEGAEVELTENVLSYSNIATKTKLINASPPSYATYYSEMSSPTVLTSVKVGLGRIAFTSTVEADPLLSSFNGFFQTEVNPDYLNVAGDGFEVTFRDGIGVEWKSDDSRTPTYNEVEFTGILQDSDSTGDYSQFICTFDCYVYNFDYSDSLKIDDAVYQGWFKR